MDNATFVFEFLLRDIDFMNNLDNAIELFKKKDLMRYKNVPQLVKTLTEVLCNHVLNCVKMGILKKNWRGKFKIKEFNLTRDDKYLLFDLYRKYILQKLTCEDTYINEFTNIYNTCISLVIYR